MKRVPQIGKMLPWSLVLILGSLAAAPGGASATMYDYCQVPPYVIQNISANVMIMVSNSASMLEFAYHPPGNLCNDSASRCGGFVDDMNNPYYGYFDPRYWYSYGSNKFTPQAPKSGTGLPGARTKNASEWDGNFLNWLTMRKVDVLRKALTGGNATGGTFTSQIADSSTRGIYKVFTDTSNQWTEFSKTAPITVDFSTGSANTTPTITVTGTGGPGPAFSTTFKVNIQNVTGTPIEGVIQGTIGARSRLGLQFFNSDSEGGNVEPPIGFTSLSSVVNRINTPSNINSGPSQPLAESLWGLAGYYAQRGTLGEMGMSGCVSGSDCGPKWHNNDYPVGVANKDPFNYGGSLYPTCAKSFVVIISDGEPCADGNIPSNLGDYANGRSAFNCTGSNCPAVSPFPGSTMTNWCGLGGNVSGLEDVSLWVRTTDLRSSTLGLNEMARVQNLNVYVVQAFGGGSTLLKYAAINGGFEDLNGNNVPDNSLEWDGNGDNIPDTYFEASDGRNLEKALRDVFSNILRRASSGTAASVLASGEGSGANLIQAVFYPRRRFGNDIINWTGSLQNLWYFVDPYFTNAYIREDTTADNTLNLANDYIAQFYFDPASEVTKVRRFVDSNGDGTPESEVIPPIGFEQLKNLWEAGKLLWQRDLSTTHRTIYTTTDGASLIPFSVGDASLISLTSLQASTSTEREQIIRFVHGEDIFQDLDADLVNDFRLRTVSYGIDNAVWKLGDIINSTPRIVGGIPLNRYKETYQDSTYSAFTSTSAYRNRGMVLAGGNDGMLHAFKLGKLELSWSLQTGTQKARLSNPAPSTPLGNEEWAFIPKNAQPYLKYLMDPDYCHLFYTDLSPYIFDASIEGNPTDTRTVDSWRTVVIGGMRSGGACRDISSSCTDCVKTPISNQGFSSYFALDVTDPTNPSLLWEFSNAELGFATTGPAVIRINALNPSTGNPDRSLNGKWYVVIGSGPTGPIDSTSYQFLGRSDQNLRFFILDLKTGNLVRTVDTGIPYAFAGSMINNAADFNLDYQDDAVYIGYVKKDSGTGEWTQGGVGRLVTKAGLSPDFGDPSEWEFSPVIDNIGPVTSAVSRLQNNTYHASWLFFGTGRYYFEIPPQGASATPTLDDSAGQRKLFGVKDPCFTSYNNISPTCTTTVNASSLTDVSSIGNVPSEAVANSPGYAGWSVDLDASGTYTFDNTTRSYRAERVITDPLSTTAGLVFFTTYKPYGDPCALGGKSFLWAMRYNTGGAPSQAMLKGKALVQVSTASVEQLDLSTAFQGDSTLHKGGRRTFAIEGVPPTAQGLSLLSPPPPVKRLMHIRER